MNIQTLAGGAALACFSAIAGLLLADFAEIEATPALSPDRIEAPSTASLPPALRDLLEGREPASGPVGIAAAETAPGSTLPFEDRGGEVTAPGRPISSWDRLQPGIDRRFSAMTDSERSANIAFVHFLARNGLELDSLTDTELAGAFDELASLLERRDQELRAIQFADLGTGAPELITGEEVDDRSWEVMERFRGLEQDLGRRFGGTDPSSPFASQ